ncbi:hypothetical protein [Thalassotalea aquiviva]|uniref:hypothetical protein n=1 Tax=Thalassotalea aquiviva TaxID=3242415 RepID=UPI00352B7BA9
MRFLYWVFAVPFAVSLAMASPSVKSADIQINPQLSSMLENVPLPEDVDGKPSRFVYLRKLLATSSGAKQVMQSSNSEAHQAYVEARKVYLQAASETDNDKVDLLLDKTVKKMYAAIRLASPKAMTDRKKKRDYERRLLSVNALLEALGRIGIEKQNQQETNKIKDYVSQLKSNAAKLAAKTAFEKARAELDEAYLLIKTGIENMRRGESLVRELSFETLEEEYAYELDRNETHKMLVKLLVEKKLASKPESFKKRIDDRVAKAQEYRLESEQFADDGDFEQAIEIIDKSTKELVKAIRMGGVFIPG